MVRSHHPGRDGHHQRHHDSAWRSGRSAPAGRLRRAVGEARQLPPAYPIPPVKNSTDPRLVARIGAIGPAPLAVNNQYLGLEYFKQLVPNAEVTLPGSVCPTCTPPNKNAIDTWLPLALAELLEGIGGGIVSPHSQSTTSTFHLVRILKERGKLHLLKGIIIPEGAGTSLPGAGLVGSDFDTIPFLLVNGDYRPLNTRLGNYAAVNAMNASPTRKVGPALSLNIEEPQFKGKLNGHTHMGMLGSTALKEFDFFLEWADKNIPNPWEKSRCSGKHDDDDDDDDHGHHRR